ncbi:hypothetical protein GF378_01725 [Candidatus Pacearchaeota archaeon]|nr:hypothetical protein [Candidatus Pacearchaeota archaeon]
MVKVTSLCTSCLQIMTNPICPSCFVKHVSYWLRDKKLSGNEARDILIGLAKVIKDAEESPSDTSCIVCGERKVNLCTHCFTSKAGRVLKNSLKNEKTLKEFAEDFNTIIWRI